MIMKKKRRRRKKEKRGREEEKERGRGRGRKRRMREEDDRSHQENLDQAETQEEITDNGTLVLPLLPGQAGSSVCSQRQTDEVDDW
jgi:hypothetical protein